MNKDNVKKFLVWMRNGIAFSFTWLTLLVLMRNALFGIELISTIAVFQLLVFVTGGVFLFTVLFSGIWMRKSGFVTRLTVFMLLFSVYEGFCFYCFGLFGEQGSFLPWLLFTGIIVLLYFLCIGIFQVYSSKKGTEYTQALQRYQQEQLQNKSLEENKYE